MKVLAFLLLLSMHLLLSSGCRCIPTTLRKDYFRPSTIRVVHAKVVDVVSSCNPCGPLDQNRRRFFKLHVIKTFKGCPVLHDIWVSSRISSAACGVNLQEGKEYVIPLTSGFLPMITSCQYIKLWSALTTNERKFLDTREICCGGACQCVSGLPPVNCVIPPCQLAEPPCREATKCVDNYCGGCFAEWFTNSDMAACELILPPIRTVSSG